MERMELWCWWGGNQVLALGHVKFKMPVKYPCGVVYWTVVYI